MNGKNTCKKEVDRMTKFTVALLQLLPGSTPEETMKKGISACRQAKAAGADIALFPEMWNCGYRIPEDIGQLKAAAVPVDGAFVQTFGALAAELDMAIAITFLEQYEPLPRNTVVLFDRYGKRVWTYAKVHTCDFGEECRLTRGGEFYVGDLDTANGTVKIGAMICYDREFPESARILMLKGAEILLVPNACPMEINRLSQLRSRAYENMLGIATCNYPDGQPDCNGHSFRLRRHRLSAGSARFPGHLYFGSRQRRGHLSGGIRSGQTAGIPPDRGSRQCLPPPAEIPPAHR